ncbi:MAG TPA: AAA family ATPase [Caulobacteraceae bacterium]|nr:AAA family ATPase [Caulobacteraceae bacterium]
MTARIVLLNGVSSVGKGSVAKALQRIASRPMLHVQMDAFLEMLPAGMFGNPEGYVFETTVQDGKPVTAVASGPVLEAVMRGMREAVASLADAGNDLIVDEVMWDPEALADYRWPLATFDFYTVGLVAPLEVIEQRERQRGDRTLGLARWQYDRVHAGMVYDLQLDTSTATPDELAEQIKLAFGL